MGCEACEGCDSCNSCENCNGSCNGSGCLSAQNFCKTDQSVGSFSFGECVTAGEFIITSSAWNKLVNYIKDAYAAGDKQNGGTPTCSTVSGSRPLLTASAFNKVSYDLFHLGGASGSQQEVETGDLVWGAYFTELQVAANSLKYKTTQCDSCNTDCDCACDTCNGCNRCQSGNTSYSWCEDPVEETG